MLVSRFAYSVLLSTLLSRGLRATATASDPCANIAGLQFVDPSDAMACQMSFKFNETLRQNVVSVVSRVFDFYTFENIYLNSPPPFQDSTTNIRAEIGRINGTDYASDYEFNLDMYNFTTQLNDGHSRWFPNCYMTYQNILPAPIVRFDDGIFIAPDSVDILNQFGPNFPSFFAAKNFDWTRLAGASVITIEGVPASDYIDEVARNVSGVILDHNVRVNRVFTNYALVNTTFSQLLGSLASRAVLTQASLNFSLIPVNSTVRESVVIPFVAHFIGRPFTDGPSYWANNCVATNNTNGVDRRSSSGLIAQSRPRLARAVVSGPSAVISPAVDLPEQFSPSLTPTNGSTGFLKSYILPGSKTGVMFVGSFGEELTDLGQFPLDVEAAVTQLKEFGVTNLLVDVTNNPGGLIYLGYFLYQYLTGNDSGYPGFQSTLRANPLAQKIVKAGIEQGHNDTISLYTPDNFQFLNGTEMPVDFDYTDPSVPNNINGVDEPTSQRFEDVWPVPFTNVTFPSEPPFDLNNLVFLGNGVCASTCALFTTAMFERHQTKMAVFGGNLSQLIQYKGAAGNQVLEWTDLDSEIKTVGLKGDPLAPPDLLVNATMPFNWRTAYSGFNENVPIAYVSEQPQYRFAYTAETYSNPQNLWLFAEKQFFG